MTPVTSDPGNGPLGAAAQRIEGERLRLVARVASMERDMAGLVDASRDSNADDEHDPEGQTIAYERSQLASLTVRSREHLAELDRAAERVAAGTYGACEVCGRPVGEGRLEARPAARTCIEHAARGGS